MACRKNFVTITGEDEMMRLSAKLSVATNTANEVTGLLFGTDCETHTDELLQNNLELFEWMVRNKVYPNFCGRNIAGDDYLTTGEAEYLHTKGVKIAAIWPTSDCEGKLTEAEGRLIAKRAALRAAELDIPEATAIFLDIRDGDIASAEFMYGYASELTDEGYVPAFRANTDARYSFDREFSRGMKLYPAIFGTCLVWATAPILSEYESMTTSHLICPDKWKPYAPSGLTRNKIAIWQYGRNCHPIETDAGRVVTFNLDLIRNERVLIDNLF